MYDAQVSIPKGEKRPVYAALDAGVGNTLTIASGGTAQLLNADETAITGWTAASVTGYDSSAKQTPQIWFDLDTTSPVALVARSYYLLKFAFNATGSDGIARTFDRTVQVYIDGPV